MSERISGFNWSGTSLGPVESWKQSLRSVLSICLNSNFPIAIYWGEDLCLLYNDAWAPMLGNKHGLGLSLCEKIVTRHQGFLTASSKPNEGAEFVVELPFILPDS